MKLERFQQIRGAFHPEDKASGLGGDKCYQIRYVINVLNTTAKKAFKVPKDLSFDEGGIGCRSRYYPVRQYNKNKPEKFRVDFFICADSSEYFILHLDVYQGKNASNVGIDDALIGLPTTQKAVANALHSLGLHLSVDGMRHISMDNRYQCPELAILLREQYNCHSTGTCRVNRKGFPLKSKTSSVSERGSSILKYDKHSRLICGQWYDSKLVHFVSTLNNFFSHTSSWF
jgi:hypothetical protein